MPEDWRPVIQQLAEMRREIGRAQGQIEAANIKLDVIQRLVRVLVIWALMLGALLALELVATGYTLALWTLPHAR